MKSRLPSAHVFVCALAALILGGHTAAATAATLIVQDGLPCPGATFFSINAAIAAASPGDTILVCAGIYEEDVVVDKKLTLKGAQAGRAGADRSEVVDPFVESEVVGSVTIQAAQVIFDGFAVVLPVPPGPSVAITVKTIANRSVVTNNVVELSNGGTPPPAGSVVDGNAIGVYLEQGPDNVRVTRNRIEDLQSTLSAQGVLVGDSLSTNPSYNILISDNLIEDIVSTTKGAYGVNVNNGARATGFATVTIRNNIIQRLTGAGWAHAIGLETSTPDAQITTNQINDIVGPAFPDSSLNAIAVFFEDNPQFATAQTHLNNFDVPRKDVAQPAAYGIAVHPALTGGSVPGTCNWWNAADGPGPVANGHGARVTTNVRFDPWLIARAPGGPCRDNNNECVADDDDDFDHDNKRDDIDEDDDNDGKQDLMDDDDDNDGKWDNDDDDDDNDCIEDRDDDKSTRQTQRKWKGSLAAGSFMDYDVAGGDIGLPIVVRCDSPNAQFLLIEIWSPLGQLVSTSLATPGSIFATTPAAIPGLYKVRIRNKGLAPIDVTRNIVTSALW